MEYDNEKKGSLWIKTAKSSGVKYMGGELQLEGKKYYISVFKNTKKERDNQPDYNLVINDPDVKYDKPQAEHQQISKDPWASNKLGTNKDDDLNAIPF